MLCKGRVCKFCRSMYAQRPTQISVLRRGKNFNDEVADYAHLGLKASHELKLVAQKRILEYIPMLHGQFAIKSPSTDPGCLHYKNKEGDSHSFFKTVGTCSCSAESCRCLKQSKGRG